MLIKNLPREIQCLVFKRQCQQNNDPDDELDLDTGQSGGNFDWDATPERFYFWENISDDNHNNGNYSEFYKKYPVKGTIFEYDEGDVVYCELENFKYIFKIGRFDLGSLYGPCVHVNKNDYDNTLPFDRPEDITNVRLATEEEIEHLEACIKADTYVRPKFEVGKWYKFNSKNGQYRLYGKCSKIFNDHFYFENSKYIDNENNYVEAGCIPMQSIENPILLTDLSEIQQYLPDNHPDKIVINKIDITMDPYPNSNCLKAEVIEDIYRKDIFTKGEIPDVIPKGYKTWFTNLWKNAFINIDPEDVVCPENNRWGANIPIKYFKITEYYNFEEPVDTIIEDFKKPIIKSVVEQNFTNFEFKIKPIKASLNTTVEKVFTIKTEIKQKSKTIKF